MKFALEICLLSLVIPAIALALFAWMERRGPLDEDPQPDEHTVIPPTFKIVPK